MMKQLIFFLSVMFFSITSFAADAVGIDSKLFLIGVVIEQHSRTPVQNASVTLIDVGNGVRKKATTTIDGQFYFKLETDKSYNLILTNENGDSEDIRTISTFNKVKSEILRAILQRSSSKTIPSASNGNFSTTPQPSYGKEVK